MAEGRGASGGSPLSGFGRSPAYRKGHSTRYRGRDHECRIRNRARVVKRLGAGIGLSVPPCSRLPVLPRAARLWQSPRLPLRPVRLSGRFAQSLGLRRIGVGRPVLGGSGAEDGVSEPRGFRDSEPRGRKSGFPAEPRKNPSISTSKSTRRH